MLGYFLFGGSDFIMLFQKKAGFGIMVQQKEDMKTYKHILMGMKFSVMSALSYHRWHSPVSGKIVKTRLVDGSYYAEALSGIFYEDQVKLLKP